MVITENIKINKKTFVRNYSDQNLMIQKVGTEEIYEEAIDLPESGFVYTETDIPIEVVDPEKN